MHCSLKQELVEKLRIPVRNTFIPKSCACQETCLVLPSLKKLLYRHARSWEHQQDGAATCIDSPASRSQRESEFWKLQTRKAFASLRHQCQLQDLRRHHIALPCSISQFKFTGTLKLPSIKADTFSSMLGACFKVFPDQSDETVT